MMAHPQADSDNVASIVTRRPADKSDRDFLFELFTQSVGPDAMLEGLDAEERATLFKMQFEAREDQYQQTWPDANFDVLFLRDEPIGNVYVDRGSNEYTLIDISLLPKYRNRGVGTAIVTELLQQAHALAFPVRAHVQKNNPALRLYERLGFEVVGDDGVYLEILAKGEGV